MTATLTHLLYAMPHNGQRINRHTNRQTDKQPGCVWQHKKLIIRTVEPKHCTPATVTTLSASTSILITSSKPFHAPKHLPHGASDPAFADIAHVYKQVTCLAITEVQSISARLFAGMWRPLVSVITTLYYVAYIICYCPVWYRTLSLCCACIRRSGIILIP